MFKFKKKYFIKGLVFPIVITPLVALISCGNKEDKLNNRAQKLEVKDFKGLVDNHKLASNVAKYNHTKTQI